jgi:CubicO group peptidase (beta-lactamase class C family)
MLWLYLSWRLLFLTRLILCALLACLCAVSLLQPAPAKDKPDEPKQNKQLAEKLEAIRDENKLPALWGAIVREDQLLAVAAVGVRKVDSTEPVTINDKVHLGSDTKAMTATLIGILIEKKKLRWDSTVGEVLPDLKDRIHADFLPVTLRQLLTHQAGLPKDSLWLPTPKGKTLREHRRATLEIIFKNAPESKPGTKFAYSNSGYVAAAVFAEEVTGEVWEDLMKSMIFKPLNMTTPGFGPPGTKNEVDQPWGHKLIKEKLTPLQQDNWRVMSPAGCIHCSVPDWAKFASLHIVGPQGKSALLKAETFKQLHTPDDGFNYAGGWIFKEKEQVLTHDGSNTLWYARIQIHPKQNVAFLVAMNQGGEEMSKVSTTTVRALYDFYRETLEKK